MSRPSVRSPYPASPVPRAYSSRTSYPSFLSLSETIQLQLNFARHGLTDAFRWDTVVQLVYTDAEVRANVAKSLLLNSVALASVYAFDLLLHPLVQGQQKWFHRNIGWFYQVLWLLPVVGVSFYLNSSWCTLLAKRTYTLQHGSRTAHQAPVTYTGLLNSLATSAYRAVMVLTSVIVSFALGYTPYVGPVAGFTFLCWIDAYYCFEFIWIARGMSLSRRVRHLEERWAYYFAFGLPSSALCTWGSGLANAALFALIFPAYIIMAMHARPLPKDPYSPSPAYDDTIRHPSPFVPIRIPIFAPVIWLNDWIVWVLSVGGGSRPGPRVSASGIGRGRAFSDGAESVEAGEGIELGAVGGGRRSTRGGIGRRKAD
ncbi:hypothetical protein PLICRDRAFT_139174 [Plicaturopsis crispa FD-325 SS-3]|nr:hypothetical protein PLICRDRAFT_139174 [Plicaturopsis crispa FD-325 SS-3]